MLFVQLTTVLRQKEQAAEESRNNYILTLEKTNADRDQHYNSTMPSVFTVITGMGMGMGMGMGVVGKGLSTLSVDLVKGQ